MQDSEFTFQDLSKNRDWLTEYDIKIGNFNEKLFIINLFLKEDITSDYSKIEIYVDNKNYYPTKIIYYYDNRSQKTMLLENIQKKESYIYAKNMRMINNITNIETEMIIESISFDIKFTEDIFNENRMSK